MGSGTPSNPLLTVDFFIGNGDFGQQEGIGVVNPKSSITGSDDAWNWGKGTWEQDTGTLKFAVLQSIPAEAPTLTVRIVLTNRDVAQDAVRPYLRICGATSWASDMTDGSTYPGFDIEGYSGPALLGSHMQTLSDCPSTAEQDCPLRKATGQGPAEQIVGAVQFESGGSVEIGTPEALVNRGISMHMYAALPQPGVLVPCNDATTSDPTPTCSTLAGKLGTVLTVKSASLTSNPLLQLRVDTSVLRRRGGCIVTDTKRSLSRCSLCDAVGCWL